jgi:hypothetical protein
LFFHQIIYSYWLYKKRNTKEEEEKLERNHIKLCQYSSLYTSQMPSGSRP